MFAKTMMIMAVALLAAGCSCFDTRQPVTPSMATVTESPLQAAPLTPEVEHRAPVEVAPEAASEPTMIGGSGDAHCTQKEDVRTISKRQQDGHWLVIYENDGVSHDIAVRSGTFEEAERLFERLKKNLAASGFHCE